MKIPIDNNRSIREIQEMFNNEFPYLKLEFSPGIRPSLRAPSQVSTKTANRLISEFRTTQNFGEITVSPEMSVTELELLFRNGYGLNVRVFRKSGRMWLETGLTSDWTLEKQNAEGESLNQSLGKRRSGAEWW